MLLSPFWNYLSLFFSILLVKSNGVVCIEPIKYIEYTGNINDELNLYMDELINQNDNINYTLTLTVNLGGNNLMDTVELGQFYNRNTINNVIKIRIPNGSCQDNTSLCSIEILSEDTTTKKSKKFYSQFFQLVKQTEYDNVENSIYISLVNEQPIEEKAHNLMVFTKEPESAITASAHSTDTPTILFKNTITNQPIYERVPILTKDLEELPNNHNIQDKSIDTLLKLYSTYDSDVKFPLTARRLHHTNN